MFFKISHLRLRYYNEKWPQCKVFVYDNEILN
jgi:hypothetical protein